MNRQISYIDIVSSVFQYLIINNYDIIKMVAREVHIKWYANNLCHYLPI